MKRWLSLRVREDDGWKEMSEICSRFLVNLTKLKNGASAKDSKADGHFEIGYSKGLECELHLTEIWLRLERGPVIF